MLFVLNREKILSFSNLRFSGGHDAVTHAKH